MNSYNGFTSNERTKALRWLQAEYAAGRRTRPTRCDACEQTEGWIEAHSENYAPPYGDHIGRYGLCYRCHMMLHCRFRYQGAFAAYCRALAAGQRFAPIHSRNFPLFASQMHRPIEPQSLGHPLPGFQRLLDEGRAAQSARTGQPDLL